GGLLRPAFSFQRLFRENIKAKQAGFWEKMTSKKQASWKKRDFARIDVIDQYRAMLDRYLEDHPELQEKLEAHEAASRTMHGEHKATTSLSEKEGQAVGEGSRKSAHSRRSIK
ncbi:unnamed protein product, partial [Chrysoparadoxa australica]